MASEESHNASQRANVEESQRNEETVQTLSSKEIEKQEEEKLKARHPARQMTGHSAFLAKRLAKGQKYFDSGDYQMAKQQKVPGVSGIPAAKIPTAVPPPVQHLLTQSTGDAIPTPESVPTRKTSLIQSKLASPAT